MQSLQAELDAARQRESELTSRIAALESRDKSTGGTEMELQQQFESRLKVSLHCQCVVTPVLWVRHACLPVMPLQSCSQQLSMLQGLAFRCQHCCRRI